MTIFDGKVKDFAVKERYEHEKLSQHENEEHEYLNKRGYKPAPQKLNGRHVVVEEGKARYRQEYQTDKVTGFKARADRFQKALFGWLPYSMGGEKWSEHKNNIGSIAGGVKTSVVNYEVQPDDIKPDVVNVNKDKVRDLTTIDMDYDPLDHEGCKEKLRKLISEEPEEVRKMNGDLLHFEERRAGMNQLLFAPKENIEKTQSVKFWKTKTKQKIEDREEKLNAGQAYSILDQDIVENRDKVSKERAPVVVEKTYGLKPLKDGEEFSNMSNKQLINAAIKMGIIESKDDKDIDDLSGRIRAKAQKIVIDQMEAVLLSQIKKLKSRLHKSRENEKLELEIENLEKKIEKLPEEVRSLKDDKLVKEITDTTAKMYRSQLNRITFDPSTGSYTLHSENGLGYHFVCGKELKKQLHTIFQTNTMEDKPPRFGMPHKTVANDSNMQLENMRRELMRERSQKDLSNNGGNNFDNSGREVFESDDD